MVARPSKQRMGAAWAAAVTATTGLAMIGLAGCGGGRATPPVVTAADDDRPVRAADPADGVVADDRDHEDEDAGDDGDGLEVGSTRGAVDPAVVSAKLEPHAGALAACYGERVGRRKWLGGGLEVAWDVRADGAIAGVRIATSDLGAWPIEKCVLAIAREVSFGPPRGRKPARVTAPLAFSAGVGAVSWDDASTARALGGRLAKLDACAQGAVPADVQITLYLGTRGRVETVGFASTRGFPDAWADCAEKTILSWALTDPRGHVAKLITTYHPTDAPPTDELDDGGADL